MIIYHHLGLGDHLICNGLVRHFAEDSRITLLCKQHNFKNVSFMYRDNTNISIIAVRDDQEANEFCKKQQETKVLRIGFAVGGKRYYNCLWDENFYRNARIDFNYSWSKFFLKPDLESCEKTYQLFNSNDEPYIFVHNIDSTQTDRINYSIINPNKKIILSDPNIDFFDYYTIIQRASEIHCIDSAFKHLVDRIPTNGSLYYHKLKYPKQYDFYNAKKEWILV